MFKFTIKHKNGYAWWDCTVYKEPTVQMQILIFKIACSLDSILFINKDTRLSERCCPYA